MEHSSGCLDFNPDDYSWFSQNQLLIGIILILLGPFIAVAGKTLFPYVAAAVASLTVIVITLIVCQLANWMSSTAGEVLCVLLALAAGVGVGILLRRST